MQIEFLWFEDCPNHLAARAMLREVLAERGRDARVDDIEVPDAATGERVRFPGSPTIRVNGQDVEPGVTDCVDCTPRCRLYHTDLGLRGVPMRAWVETAVDLAIADERSAQLRPGSQLLVRSASIARCPPRHSRWQTLNPATAGPATRDGRRR
ncbi:MAG: hypothetical protein O2895_04120 [Chloroflexi bacterium]|nr:hypothetical protein [Chloroflexota bacterium]